MADDDGMGAERKRTSRRLADVAPPGLGTGFVKWACTRRVCECAWAGEGDTPSGDGRSDYAIRQSRRATSEDAPSLAPSLAPWRARARKTGASRPLAT